MKPLKQTSFGWPGGNCYAACMASLLEISIEDCPIVPADQVADWDRIWKEWLADRNLARVVLSAEHPWRPEGWYIACGTNPRNIRDEQGELVNHAVIAKGDELIFDPHPDDAFLLDFKYIDLLYPIDLAKRAFR